MNKEYLFDVIYEAGVLFILLSIFKLYKEKFTHFQKKVFYIGMVLGSLRLGYLILKLFGIKF